MSADTQSVMTGFGQKRSAFRDWRGRRPFWGGLLTLLAGIPIMYIPYQNLTLGSLTIRMSTTAGAGSLIIGVLLVVLGITMWFQPQSRVFAGVAAILLSLVSLVVSNIGAFLIGFLLGLLGGALGVSWVPGKPSAATPQVAESTADPVADPVAEPAVKDEPRDVPAQSGPPATEHTASANDANDPNANGRQHRAG
ncbi:DUF6114 domain-containing protein [Streptomyces sp. NPDC048172]|uniref:DUF6114 domain-containing protein n=1 Tax=Streptomyces sp. NPDC048172 TaxID=3365505 RepID=UPI0037212E4B